MVFVSHDRYFIDKLATRVIEVADGGVHVFPGNYEDYLWRKSALAPGAATAAPPVVEKVERGEKKSAPSPAVAKAPQAAPPPPANDKQRRLNPIKLRQIKERQRAIEDEVTRLEVEIADFEAALSNFQTAEHSIEIAELLESRRRDMKDLMTEWEDVSQTIEANR